MNKVIFFVYNNTGYRCNNLKGSITYNCYDESYVVLDRLKRPKGRVFQIKDEEELKSELGLMFPSCTRLFLTRKEIKD